MLRAQLASTRLLACRHPWTRHITTESPRHKREKLDWNLVNPTTVGRDRENKTIFIRTWDPMRSPADSLAIVQYLEKAFGPIEEFNCPREGDWYASFLLVRFVDTASRTRALNHGSILQVPAPPMTSNIPAEGGTTLAEVQPYIETQARQEGFQTNLTGPVPDFEIGQPTPRGPHESPFLTVKISEGTFYETPRPRSNFRTMPKQSARHFVRWGGFANLQPVPSKTPLTVDGEVDHVVMRYAIRHFAKELQMQNLYEYEDEPGTSLKWTPAEPSSDSKEASSSTSPVDGWDEWKDIEIENEQPFVSVEAEQPESQPEPEPQPDPEPVVEATKPPPSSPPLTERIAAMAAASAPRPISKEGKAQVKAANDILQKVTKPKAKAAPTPKGKQSQAPQAQKAARPRQPNAKAVKTEPPREAPVQFAPQPTAETTAPDSKPESGNLSGKLKRFLGW
ncbi:hypothetical protein VKT23_000580 [Stygiomarasmius scandens]|uniref:Uncharacterized protein n=1 Tax=Marasmiellus scandens TaxID=2682957 RepID=A0ABR1K6Z9_9AGAR